MKYDALKLTLTKHAVIALGVLAGAAAVTAGLAFLENSREEKRAALSAEVAGLQGKVNTTRTDLVKARQSLSLYQQLVSKNKGEELKIDRENARRILDRLKTAYFLGNLKLNVSPVSEVKDPALQKKTTKTVVSDVDLSFDGVSDVHLLSFIDAVRTYFPGYIRVVSLSLNRASAPGKDAYIAISKGTIPTLVRGQAKLKWYGLEIQRAAPPPVPAPAIPAVEP